jgi:hypothetical protein
VRYAFLQLHELAPSIYVQFLPYRRVSQARLFQKARAHTRAFFAFGDLGGWIPQDVVLARLAANWDVWQLGDHYREHYHSCRFEDMQMPSEFAIVLPLASRLRAYHRRRCISDRSYT